MKRWAKRKVTTVKFSTRTQRHAVGPDGRTYCSIDIAATVALGEGKYDGTVKKLPIHEVRCIECLKRGGFLSRWRKGKCLVGQAPGNKPVHLVYEFRHSKGGADGNKRITPTGCNLDFTKHPEDVRAGTYRQVTCKHCLLSSVELPWD